MTEHIMVINYRFMRVAEIVEAHVIEKQLNKVFSLRNLIRTCVLETREHFLVIYDLNRNGRI
jgi:hypothetical protein